MTEKDGEKDTMRSVLASFCQWLENLGYLDDDWWCEEPKAVDRFLAENPRMEKIIKELRTRVAELTKKGENLCTSHGLLLCAHDTLKKKNEELQNRLSTLEKEARNLAGVITDKDDKILSLLKASEGMEKALEMLYSELVESNSSRCDEWSTPAKIIKQALADFRAVKENMEKGAGND